MACCSHLFIFHFKDKFTGQEVTFQRFIKRSKDLVKKLNLWFYLTQIVLSNGKILFPWRKNCLSKFLWCTAHTLLFLTFFKEKLGVSEHVSKSFAQTVFTCVKKMLHCIFQLCLLHEDGIVEACISSSIWQNNNKFLFNGKIISLLVNTQSVNFLSKCPIAKC